jgi:hypothetical protein
VPVTTGTTFDAASHFNDLAPVPEPGTAVLRVSGLMLLGRRLRRRGVTPACP